MAERQRTTLDLSGRTFARLTALTLVQQNNRTAWLCRCECGNELVVRTTYLTSGHTRSCGCLQVEACTTHGMAPFRKRSLGYRTWNAMLQRCTNQNHAAYAAYGGAGIMVCDRWLSYENFLSDMGQRPAGATIDRIDNAKGYSPDNCRWATQKQQQRNKGTNRTVEFKGQTKCLSEWAEEYGLYGSLISARLRLGWSIERALTTPHVKR